MTPKNIILNGIKQSKQKKADFNFNLSGLRAFKVFLNQKARSHEIIQVPKTAKEPDKFQE